MQIQLFLYLGFSPPLSVDALGDALDEELLRRPQEDPGPPFGAPVIVEPRDLPLRPTTHSPPHGLTHRDAPGLARRSAPEEACKSLVSLVYHPTAGERPSAAARLPCGSLLFVNEINIC